MGDGGNGADEGQATVDAIDAPALLLGPKLELIAANDRARARAAVGDVFAIAGGRFAPHVAEERSALLAAAQRLLGAESWSFERLLLAVESDPVPLIARLQRECGGLLLVLCTPALPSGEALVKIGTHYRLTSAENGLLAAMLQGDTLTCYAQSRGIGREAARFHAKALFAKTGTHRQTELVRLVLMIAVGLDARG